MRETKFRFWDSEEKRMSTDPDIGITMNGQPVYLDWGGGVNVEKHLVPMQFTGLLDKNGVEIYEGDIIELNTSREKFVAPVVFNQEEARFDLEHPEGYHGHWGLNMKTVDACDYKVIGNIYQNPELLKKE